MKEALFFFECEHLHQDQEQLVRGASAASCCLELVEDLQISGAHYRRLAVGCALLHDAISYLIN